VFRVDASEVLGIGHVMRCANLAKVLRARGADVRFISRPLRGNLTGVLRARGFDVDVIGETAPVVPRASGAGHAEALGTSAQDDAAGTHAVLADRKTDWLVVDHYALDEAWERAVRADAARIMAIDDLPARRHDCDLLLDQNASALSRETFAARVPARSVLALGPRYALLDAEYARLHVTRRQPDGAVRRVLVTFGGSDPLDLTGRALSVLSRPEFAGIDVDIVAGANYQYQSRLQHAADQRPRTHVHAAQPSLAPLLANADLAIGAGGTTTWERFCIGVPSIVVCMAENQRPGCEHLASQELIEYCGAAATLRDHDLVDALRRSMESGERLRDIAARGLALVDGLGARRIAEHLWPTPAGELRLRRAAASDVYCYFDWVNEAEVRRQSLRDAVIEFSEHQRWFDARIARPGCQMFVMLAGELPVGQIRFDVTDGQARIDYSIDHFFRGRGWGRQLLALGMRAMPAGTSFRGEVRSGNAASCAVFERAGFEERLPRTVDGLRVFVREVPPCE
jgi:UDP-2,4-diacetamido-2,4,6-trideoxy-beta-L-altropyranose hydrolase